MENKKEIKEEKNFIKVIKGSIISIIISLGVLLFIAILFTYTNIPEKLMPVIIIAISAISIMVGSIISTKNIKNNGLINGGIVGIIYIVTIYLLSSILVCGFNINIKTIIMICICIVVGMIGGIIGVNYKK